MGENTISNETLLDALGYLKDKELIKGTSAWGGEFLRVGLTVQGRDHLEREKSLSDDDTFAQANTYNFNAQTNFQQGNHNVQNVQVGVSDEKVQAIIDALRADNEVELAEDIQTEVVQAKQPGKIIGFMGKLITAAATAGSSSVTTQALTQLFN